MSKFKVGDKIRMLENGGGGLHKDLVLTVKEVIYNHRDTSKIVSITFEELDMNYSFDETWAEVIEATEPEAKVIRIMDILDEAMKQDHPDLSIETGPLKSVSHALSMAFLWEHTSEGYEFWRYVDERLKRLLSKHEATKK